MEENKNEPEVEIEPEEETPEADLTPETDWEAEAKKARGIAQRLRTKLTKAEEKKVVVEATKPVKEVPKTGELDETQLDYLDLKGITESDDIEVIKSVIAKTGQTVRQVLKDSYVSAKLAENKAEREVKNATPSATKRGGSQNNDLAQALAKFEQTGELPQDFTLRSAVVNASVDRANTNKPSWH